MAFKSANLTVIAYANGWTMWHYSNNEMLEDIEKDHYFDKVWHLGNTGDIIVLNGKDGTAIRVMELTEDKHINLTKLRN
jgi:hypothetical protein